jgi:hypothetical protein
MGEPSLCSRLLRLHRRLLALHGRRPSLLCRRGWLLLLAAAPLEPRHLLLESSNRSCHVWIGSVPAASSCSSAARPGQRPGLQLLLLLGLRRLPSLLLLLLLLVVVVLQEVGLWHEWLASARCCLPLRAGNLLLLVLVLPRRGLHARLLLLLVLLRPGRRRCRSCRGCC